MPDGTTEYYATFDPYGSPTDHNRPDVELRLLPGTATVSPPIPLESIDWGNAGHISGRGPNGVALVTSDSDPSNGWTAFEGEVWLVSTGGQVQRLAHTRSTAPLETDLAEGYWIEPRA